jgi:GntR family transcriptional regulator
LRNTTVRRARREVESPGAKPQAPEETVLESLAARVGVALGDKGHAGPKHPLVYDAILAEIEAGRWKPGDRLPPEVAFVRVLPFSLGTVQRALSRLAEDGIVYRQHRRGTFVSGAAEAPENLVHFRFRDVESGELLPVYNRVLSLDIVEDRGPWSEFLGRTQRFIRIQRALNINLEFGIYNELHLSYRRFQRLAQMPLRELDGTALTYTLDRKFNAPTLRTEQRLRVCSLPRAAAPHVGLAPGSLVMEWEIHAYTYRDKPLLLQRSWVPPSVHPLEIREPMA